MLMKPAQRYTLPPTTSQSSTSKLFLSVVPWNQHKNSGTPCTSKATLLEEDPDCRPWQSPPRSRSALLWSSVLTFQWWIKQMDMPHRHSRNQKYISCLQLLIWDWGMFAWASPHPFQIKFRWDRNATQSSVLRLSGSRFSGGESNASHLRHGTAFHPQIIICPVTNGYCKIFINLSAYKNCEFLIQSSIWLLNFIFSLARSLGMWLQSKLKSNHMWITFPRECNDFRRLINVKQCLS